MNAVLARAPLTRAALLAGAIAVFLALWGSAATADAEAASACPGTEIRTASGCTSRAEAASTVRTMIRSTVRDEDLRAALVRVDVGDRRLVSTSPGESMAGVPATMRMRFRTGAIAIPYVINLLLQLQDRGKLSLDDPVSEWLPDLPNAEQVTLRMLANSTSGYPDWIQGNPEFADRLYANPFRQWSTQKLLDVAFSQPLICAPGTCFHYAHTNFAILGKVIQMRTGRSMVSLLRKRVLAPLRLRHTEISGFPAIPPPALHAYVADRGPYEDSTSWSPSWGLPNSMLMTATIADIVKSAKAMGTGELISRRASRERFAPDTARLPNSPFTNDFYYGLGVLVLNGWQFQNPELNGYVAISAYLPARRIALGVAATKGPRAARTDTNFSVLLFDRITNYLTPGHHAVVPKPPGS